MSQTDSTCKSYFEIQASILFRCAGGMRVEALSPTHNSQTGAKKIRDFPISRLFGFSLENWSWVGRFYKCPRPILRVEVTLGYKIRLCSRTMVGLV